MFRKMVLRPLWLERLWFWSKCCRRCGAPKPDGRPGAPEAAAQVPRRNRKRGTRPLSKLATLPEVAVAKWRTKRARQLRKAGAHTRNLTLAGSNAGVLWGLEVLGFTLRAIRVDAAKATCRLSHGQNAATTVMAHAQVSGAKNVDPAFRHHRQVVLAWATGVWEGVPDLDTMQAVLRVSIARLSSLKRLWCGATDAAATLVRTVLRLVWSAQSATHLATHDGTTLDLFR